MCVKLLLIVYVSSVLADTDTTNCRTNKCYQTVNNSYENLLNLIKRFNATVSQAEIPTIYDLPNLENDLADLDDIKRKIQSAKTALELVSNRVNRTEKNTSKEQKVVNQLLETLSNISDYETKAKNILTEAKTQQNDLERLLELGENASKTCQQANDKYTEFKKIIDNAIKDYDDVSKNYDNVTREVEKLNKDVNNTFQETIKTKNKFEELKIPTNLVDNYLLEQERKFNESIRYLKNNSETLKNLLKGAQDRWNDQLAKRATDVAKNISQIQDDLNKMNEELRNYERALNETGRYGLTVNNESRNLLEMLRNELEKLRNLFDSVNFTDEERELLDDNKDDERNIADVKRRRLLIKEYNLILDTLINGINVKEIRKQINTLKTTISLIEQWKRLESELFRLRANRDAILKINCTVSDGSTIIT